MPKTVYHQELMENGVTALPPLFTEEGLGIMLKEAAGLTFTPKESPTPTGVIQDFSSVESFPQTSFFYKISRAITRHLTFYVGDHLKDFASNDLALQRYEPSTQNLKYAISPHRDHVEYVNVIVILLIKGPSAFFVCDTREGTNPRGIDISPGGAIVLRAKGYAGTDLKPPFHFVRHLHIGEERLTFSMRQSNKRPPLHT